MQRETGGKTGLRRALPSATPCPSDRAETGDCYMLKLFRDYVFHQVDAQGPSTHPLPLPVPFP